MTSIAIKKTILYVTSVTHSAGAENSSNTIITVSSGNKDLKRES